VKKPAAFLLLSMSCLLLVYYTGTLAPNYGVIAPDSPVELGGSPVAASALASRFEPLLSGEAASACWFEPLPPKDGRMAVLYRFSWPDERHPIAALHYVYALWRSVYFGSRQDIEYVWVEADLKTGKPVRVAFESPDVGKVFVNHDFNLLDRFPMQGTHPLLKVASWNHIFQTVSGERGSVVGEAVPLQFLDDAAFRDLRMGRRSLPPTVLLVQSPS